MEASDTNSFIFIIVRILTENLKQRTATHYGLKAGAIQNRILPILTEEFLYPV